MLILVNKGANGGRASESWDRIERELRSRGMNFLACPTSSIEEVGPRVTRGIQDGHDVIVAAGGDGTVNAVLNRMMDLPRVDVALGAIGLGSSNDFHKPLNPDRMVAGVPVRISPRKGILVDVGKAVLCDPDGGMQTRYFLLNASLGFVAEGNAFFNTNDPTLLWLKRRNVEAAILYTAFVNLLRFQSFCTRIRLDDSFERVVPLSSLGVLKKVHFAGGMRYDTSVAADDGRFDVNLWEGMNRADIVRTMANLYRGRFSGLPRTRSWRASRVRIVPERPASFELDGEVRRITSADLAVVPRALRVCG